MKQLIMAGRFVLLLAGMTVLLTGCGGVFNPQGPVAKDQYWLILLSFFIMIVVLAVVFTLYFYILVRFRKRKEQVGYPEQVEGNYKLEIVWTVIPFILIMVLSVFTVAYTFKADRQSESGEGMTIKVIAHQFWWEFVYPDQEIRTAQDLVIPENQWITVELTSADVIHSFWIPQLAGKMDANPGLSKKMSFKSDASGTIFRGKCAELCGASHALMDFKVVTLTAEDFDAWVTKMKTPAELTEATRAGEEIFTNKCLQCHAVNVEDAGAGPNLAGFGSRTTVAGYRDNNEEWLSKWLLDPQEVKPGTAMPNVGLSEQEVDQLVQYLHSLK